jgi:hypothetical protein
MQPGKPQPGGKVPGSPDFLIALAVIGSFVACFAVGASDSAPRGLKAAALAVLLPATTLLMVGMGGGLLLVPLWAMWKGARAADAKRPPPTGTLTVAPDVGPLAPQALPKDRPVFHHWRSKEWVLSGLGIAGEVGGIACLLLGWTTAAAGFGVMFLVGAGGWLFELNLEGRPEWKRGVRP